MDDGGTPMDDRITPATAKGFTRFRLRSRVLVLGLNTSVMELTAKEENKKIEFSFLF